MVKKPDWEFWRSLRSLEVWQAVALSVHADPDSVAGRYDGWGETTYNQYKFPSREAFDKFTKRLRIVESHITSKGPFTLITLVPNKKYCEIRLREFADWAVGTMGWNDLPRELLDIDANIDSAPTVDGSTSGFPNPKVIAPPKGDGRSTILDQVIADARASVKNGDDYQQVWAELERVAELSARPAPLLGPGDVGEGIKYLDDGKVKYLTKGALRKRLGRGKKQA